MTALADCALKLQALVKWDPRIWAVMRAYGYVWFSQGDVAMILAASQKEAFLEGLRSLGYAPIFKEALKFIGNTFRDASSCDDWAATASAALDPLALIFGSLMRCNL